MKCNEVLDLVSDYVGGSMEKPLRVAVAAHLGDCTSCREAYDGVGKLWRELDALPAVDAPAELHTAVWAGIASRRPEASPSRRVGFSLPSLALLLRPRSLALAGAAVIILSAFVSVPKVQKAELGPGWLLQLVMHHGSAVPPANSSYAEWTQAPNGARLFLHLQLPVTPTGTVYSIRVAGAAAASVPGAQAAHGIITLVVPITSDPIGDSLDITATPESGGASPIQLHLKLWRR
ncbi:MAG: zf-HC2 domain-containing protein [Armatimonadetes bacterium]|nr:zf-HC2 domain-containing protein [Armatimonadota bacterium]MDE2207155.1 zf-HC2 domain-containing protein [Armatimonadota bacterium]